MKINCKNLYVKYKTTKILEDNMIYSKKKNHVLEDNIVKKK